MTWGVEGMSPNYLARRGWSKNTFKPGDKVTLTIRPMRDGSPGGMFVRGILADGKPVTFAATSSRSDERNGPDSMRRSSDHRSSREPLSPWIARTGETLWSTP